MTTSKQANILLVDDHPANLLALEAVLEDPGLNLVRANSGPEALRLVAEQEFAVILLDVRMPEMDGFETATRIRQQERSRATPIIFVTVEQVDEEQESRAYELGAVDFLVGPTRPRILREKVAVFVNLYRRDLQLNHSRQQLAEAQQLAHMGSWEWDIPGDVVTWSDELYRIYGLQPQEFAASYEGFLARVHPDDRALANQVVQDAYRTHQPFAYDHRIVRPDGVVPTLHGQGKVILDERGTPVRMVGTGQDVTEARQIEEALRHSEARFRRLVEDAPDAMVIADGQGHIELVNAQTERLFGYERAELLGQPVEILLPDRFRRAHEAHRGPYMQQPSVRPMGAGLELWGRRKDGTEFPVEISLSPMGVGDRPLVAAAIRDVTARRELEEQRLRLARVEAERVQVEAANRRLAVQHAAARVLAELESLDDVTPRVLAAVCAALDWAVGELWIPDEQAGLLRCAHLSYFPADAGEEFESLTREMTFAPGVGLPGRVWADRQPHWITDVTQDANFARHQAARASGLRTGVAVPIAIDDQFTGVMVFLSRRAQDPDDMLLAVLHAIGNQIGQFIRRKQAEAALRASEARLQQAQKLESLGVLAGGIAHDFNNLLQSVLGHAELLLLKLPADSPTSAGLEQISKAARRAAELTSQMLAYSGKGKFVVWAVDLSGLVQEMRPQLAATLPEQVELRCRLAADLPAIEADVLQLRQVITGMVANAAEAIGERDGAITVTTGMMEVDQAYLADHALDGELPTGSYVYVEIADTGHGMDTATRARIFDPFFSTKFTGRGLGLSAAQGIVRGHKGKIRVHSEPGHGSEFRVVLPCAAQPPPAPIDLAPLSGNLSRGGETVLVVDDEPGVRDVARMALEEAGYAVLIASDGQAAVETFRTHADEIAVVLLDLTMPRLSGEEAFRAIRAIRADACVILSSGYSEGEVTGRFGEQGLAGFLQKPYQPRQLLTKVREVLDKVVAWIS